mgnify:CR=1 FL=1
MQCADSPSSFDDRAPMLLVLLRAALAPHHQAAPPRAPPHHRQYRCLYRCRFPRRQRHRRWSVFQHRPSACLCRHQTRSRLLRRPSLPTIHSVLREAFARYPCSRRVRSPVPAAALCLRHLLPARWPSQQPTLRQSVPALLLPPVVLVLPLPVRVVRVAALAQLQSQRRPLLQQQRLLSRAQCLIHLVGDWISLAFEHFVYVRRWCLSHKPLQSMLMRSSVRLYRMREPSRCIKATLTGPFNATPMRSTSARPCSSRHPLLQGRCLLSPIRMAERRRLPPTIPPPTKLTRRRRLPLLLLLLRLLLQQPTIPMPTPMPTPTSIMPEVANSSTRIVPVVTLPAAPRATRTRATLDCCTPCTVDAPRPRTRSTTLDRHSPTLPELSN